MFPLFIFYDNGNRLVVLSCSGTPIKELKSWQCYIGECCSSKICGLGTEIIIEAFVIMAALKSCLNLNIKCEIYVL